jgi:general secretion pathway protein D
LKLRILFCLFAALSSFAASDGVAARLAKRAKRAQNAGQLVRAYLLFAEAAARDPQNASYAVNRDAIAPLAKLLTKVDVQKQDISADIKEAESAPPTAEEEQALSVIPAEDVRRERELQPPPHLQPSTALRDFDLRLDERAAITEVAKGYGINAMFDPQFDDRPIPRFAIDRVDFRTAMEALTAVTHTFVFPLSPRSIFVARDNDQKRNEFEPTVLLTVPLLESIETKEIVDAANAVRGALALRGGISWDSVGRTVVIRDHVTRARIARSLLEALLLPKAQVSFEVQLMTVDSNTNYHYGAALQSSFQIFNFSKVGGFQRILPDLTSLTNVFAFGVGSAFFGVTLTDATFFATYSKSTSRNLFDATVVVADGQTANLHVGDKYPIPQSLYSGFQQSGGASLYNPIGQVTLEDLGLVLKLIPRVNGDGDISLEVEAEYKALGTQTLETVPSITQREFKGTVRLREGEWAILAGMDETDQTRSKSGIIGLAQIPGLDQVLGEHTYDKTISNTLIVIKPTVTRLPMSNWISPQYLLGPVRGWRVLL